ncbi:hypothetical protein [Alkalimarinus coralli]|uniref:hypothetical protein n=1 Tax=Alkalimarinus coralli TaxID=2935863 RepID=UPI00202ADB33|nr:hypothetical protein [Alkalimarinus coralli]
MRKKTDSLMPRKLSLLGDFPGKRWLKIILRTLHILSVIGVGGAVLFNVPFSQWVWYWYAAVATGVAMVAIDALSNFLWLVQIRGIVIYIKLLLLMFLGGNMLINQLVLITIVVISAIISHAPGDIRYYSIVHRRRINSFHDSKG